MNPLLEIKDVWLGYNTNPVIKGVSLTVETGKIVALLGRNGSGKSTILRGIAGELIPKQGMILFQGLNVTGLKPRSLIQKGISYMPQGKEVFPDLSVEENLELALLPLGLNREERKERKQKASILFPSLSRVLKKPVHHISGGLRQMLSVAMVLSQEPKCVLLDEPSHGLADSALTLLESALKDFVNSGGSILLVEQKPKFAFDIGDYAYYIEDGKIEIEGDPKTIMNNPRFIKGYIGLD